MSDRNDMYEHQFWSFSVKDLLSGLRNVVYGSIQGNIETIGRTLKNKTPEELWPDVSSSCQTLLEEYSQKANEHLPAIEAYIQENFSIPPHILLEEDTVQRKQYSDEERENLDREITELKKRINRVHFMEYHLLEQLEKNKELNTISEKVLRLPIPHIDKNKDLQHMFSKSIGLEVEAANCYLKDDNSEDSNEFNSPDYALKALKKKQNVSV